MRIGDVWGSLWVHSYIERNNRDLGLDTPEKRLQALNARMKAAKEAERQRVAFERATAMTAATRGDAA